jgi:hypothetical protein
MAPLNDAGLRCTRIVRISILLITFGSLILGIAASHSGPFRTYAAVGTGETQPQPEVRKQVALAENFTIEPSQLARGSSHTIAIVSKDCQNKTFGADDGVIIKSDIDDLKNRKGVEITRAKKTDACRFTAELTITESAAFGPLAIDVHYQEGGTDHVETLMIRIVKEEPLPPGPLVPGLDPQVDIFWAVVPQKIVKDNFGSRVGKLYYCIEVVIGNDTGYELQIASVGFNLGPVGKAASAMNKTYKMVVDEIERKQKEQIETTLASIDSKCPKLQGLELIKCRNKVLTDQVSEMNAGQQALVDAVKGQADLLTQLSRVPYAQKVPVSSYRMTRGSIEHGRFLSLRNLGINSLKTLGPILTGFLPFFHALGHQTNFSEGINVLNNPIEKGFELLIPDETIAQMQRLDEDMLRDGMIIQNNRQIRTRVFVPKDLLKLDGSLRDDPMMVTQALGEMYLIGDKIQFLNRISVTSSPSGEVTPPPTVNPRDRVFELNGDKDQTLSIDGTNLEGAVVFSPDPNIDKIGNPSTTKNTLSVSLRVEDTASPGGHTLTVQTKSGTVTIPITVKLPAPALDSEGMKAFRDDPALESVLPAEMTTQTKQFTGRFLQGARLAPLNNNPLTAKVVETDPAGKSIKVTFTLPAKLPPTNYLFGVANADNNELPATMPPERIITVTVAPRGVPEILEVKPETGPNPVTVNPSKDTSVTLLVEGRNLNDLVAKLPVVQSASDKPRFSLDAKSAALVSNSVRPFGSAGDVHETVQVNLTVPKGTPKGEYHFALVNEQGPSKDFVFKVERQEALTLDPVKQSLVVANEGTGTVTLTGTNLDGAQVLNRPEGWTIDIDKDKSTQNQLVLNITAPTTFTDATLTFKVANTNGDTDTDRPPATVNLRVIHPAPPPAPTITKFQIAAADVTGAKPGDSIVILGQNFKGASVVTFGNVSMNLNPVNTDDGRITIMVPQLPASADGIDVKVTTPGGDSPAKKLVINQP